MNLMPNLVPRSPSAKRKGDLVKFDFKARYTGFPVVLSGPSVCCDRINMDEFLEFDGVILRILRDRGLENFVIKAKQKEALREIVLKKRDC